MGWRLRPKASLSNANDRYLSLTGVIVELDYARDTLLPALEQRKERYFGSHPDDPVCLRRKELGNQRPPFDVLRDLGVTTAVDAALRLLENLDDVVLTAVVDKLAHVTQYKEWANDPYPPTPLRSPSHSAIRSLRTTSEWSGGKGVEMKRIRIMFTALAAVTALVALLPAVAAAQGSPRPDDRAVHGAGAIAAEKAVSTISSSPTRRDDRGDSRALVRSRRRPLPKRTLSSFHRARADSTGATPVSEHSEEPAWPSSSSVGSCSLRPVVRERASHSTSERVLTREREVPPVAAFHCA